VHFYQHHIGDFNGWTRHSTRVERSLYRDLLDMYYDTEAPIQATDFDRLARKLCCSEEDKPSLRVVLADFFTLDGDVYRNTRCDLEIAAYQNQLHGASRAGKASAAKRAAKAEEQRRLNAESAGVQRPLNDRCADVQPTINHEPLTIKEKEKAPAAPSLTFGELESEGLTRETAVEFLALRNRKRARLTRKAWDGIKAEIDKAGWTPERAILKAISRGWTAFEAAWVAEAVKPADIARTTVPADPASFNRTKEAPLTAEEKAAAEEVRKRLFPIKRIAA
jgi:uncharacterized protein YdaU (DUF1376 family)